MKARVLKFLTHEGKVITPGTVVDVSGWRNAKTLVAGRYIKIEDEVADLAVETKVLVEETSKPKPKKVTKTKDE